MLRVKKKLHTFTRTLLEQKSFGAGYAVTQQMTAVLRPRIPLYRCTRLDPAVAENCRKKPEALRVQQTGRWDVGWDCVALRWLRLAEICWGDRNGG